MEQRSGWRAVSPLGSTASGDAELDDPVPMDALGEVHVVVFRLEPGGGEVRLGCHGVRDLELIDAALTELLEARRILAERGQRRQPPRED
jgi:hypothetical protein